MVIRLSQQMQKKLHLTIHETSAPFTDPLADWSLHLFRYGRTQYILATNTHSLFSVLMLGRGVTDEHTLLSHLIPALHQAHEDVGMEDAFVTCVEHHIGNVTWSKVGNRAVTGSMNQIVDYAWWLLDEPLPHLRAINLHLNDFMLSYIQYQRPVEAHRQLIRP